jgi:hypothetical protein
MLQNLINAQWHYTKGKAELTEGSTTFIEMEFKRKTTFVKIGKKEYEISKDGFWCPGIKVTEKDKVIALQKQVGIWGTKSGLIIDDQKYTVKTREGKMFNIIYSNSTGDILIFQLATLKNKPEIIVEIRSFTIPEQHLLILLAVGFYSMKNVAEEALANDFLVTAVA